MGPNTCCETLSFVPFSTDESFINNENDPDVNFYNDVFTLDTQYLAPDKFRRNFKPFQQSLFILHLNIRSIKKFFFFTCLLISISALFVFQKYGLMI